MKFLSTKEGQKHAFTFAPMYKKRLCDRLLAPTPRFLLCITMYLIKYLSSPDLNLFWVSLIVKDFVIIICYPDNGFTKSEKGATIQKQHEKLFL